MYIFTIFEVICKLGAVKEGNKCVENVFLPTSFITVHLKNLSHHKKLKHTLVPVYITRGSLEIIYCTY